MPDISGYQYYGSHLGCHHRYLLPAIESVLSTLKSQPKRVFDLGCGSGAFASWLTSRGCEVIGCDPSPTGIAEAKKACPGISFHVGSCYDPLHEKFGCFPIVTSLEVVEHVYSPREFASCVTNLLVPGGTAIISTPYHGYAKNLMLAATGKMDAHFTALWDHGHIKFWSVKTLSTLLAESGLRVKKVIRVGRVPPLAKSMIFVAERR